MKILICVIFCCLGQTYSLTEENRKLVESWAPVVYLHSEDPFFPSSVEFHLENVQVRSAEEIVLQDFPTVDSILTGEETNDYHLNTRAELECVNCFQPFFSGQPVEEVPCYTIVTEHNDTCSTLDITYTTFYPFNYGKDVCVGIDDQEGFCLGEVKTFGNHVGDWEHVSLRLQGGEPVEMFISVHSFGAWYNWDRDNNSFVFSRGEPLVQRIEDRPEVRVEVDYPTLVNLEDGRPAVYSANGSHGIWAQPGIHTYLQIFTVHLEDICDRGTAWNTWNNLAIYETKDLDEFTGVHSWLNFRGAWGNEKKLGCELEPIFGECGLVGGPGGPTKYFGHDFQQPPTC